MADNTKKHLLDQDDLERIQNQFSTSHLSVTDDIEANTIKSNDKSTLNSLEVETNAVIDNDLTVEKNTNLQKNASVGGTLGVTGKTTLSDDLEVIGNSTVGGTLCVTGKTTLSDDLSVTGNTSIGGTLGVIGKTTLSDDLSVTGNGTVGGTLGVTGNTSLSTLSTSGKATLNSLSVTGKTTLSDDLSVTGNSTVGGTLGVTGNTSLSTLSTSGKATLNSLGVTGNTSIGGTLGVTGKTTLSDDLSVTGNGTVGGTLGVTGKTTIGSSTSNTKIENNSITTGTVTATTFTGALAGNASSASKLFATKKINGTDFDGTTDITTEKWGTSRKLTIAGVEKSVNGSGNIEWTKTEMGLNNVDNTADSNKHVAYSDESGKTTKSLKVQYNSTDSFTFNGSSDKTVNIKQGVGLLITGDSNGNITPKIKTRSETALNIDSISAVSTGTTNRLYPVQIDKSGYLAVNVPWNVTGVKGNAETSYRTGDINLTPANLGLGKTLKIQVDSTDKIGYTGTEDKSFNIATGSSNGTISFGGTDVSVKGLGSRAYDSTSYLPLAGGTMTGQILTSFKSSVAMGSYQATSTKIEDLCNELRYSSGVSGSANITTAYTKDGVTISAMWYNFLWITHRSGGINGAASGDNCNYGTLFLSGMTGSGCFIVRFSSGSIAEVRYLYKDTTYSNLNQFTNGPGYITSTLGSSSSNGVLTLVGPTAASVSHTSDGANILFKNANGDQSARLKFSDYDSYATGVSLTLTTDQNDAYFIAPHIKATSGFVGNLSGTASDSSKLNGYASATNATANTIARRDGNGYLYATYYNQSSGAETPTTNSYIIYANSDGWFRKSSLANIKSILGLGSAAYTASTAYAASSHTHTKSNITDFPSSLKNPNSLKLQVGGTDKVTYDGSSEKSFNITTGDNNGTIKFGGTNVSVKGLGSLAYKNSIAYSEITSTPSSLKNPNSLKLQVGGTDKVTYDGSAAKSFNIASGSSNGTISFGGTDVSVKGLGSRAYDSTSYLPLAGGTMTGSITLPGDTTSGIFPAKDTYALIGTSGKRFWKCYSEYGYFNRIECDTSAKFTTNVTIPYDGTSSNLKLSKGETGNTGYCLEISQKALSSALTIWHYSPCHSMYISHTGNDGCGIFASSSDSNGAAIFYAKRSNTTKLGFFSEGKCQASAYESSSSKHVKENIHEITDSEAMKLLNAFPIHFDFKKEFGGEKDRVGLIAEDMLNIIPQVVNIPEGYDENDIDPSKGLNQKILTIDYSKIVPHLIKLCQVQQKQIDSLSKQISDFKNLI